MAGHVCHIITRLDVIGGAQMHVLHLARSLRERGWQVTVVGGGEGPFADMLRETGVPCVSVPELVHPIHPSADRRALQALTHVLRVLRPDLVCCHSSKAGFLGRWAARRLDIPAIFTAHGWAFTPGPGPARRLLALAAEHTATRWSRRIICVSDFDRLLALRYRVAPPRLLVTVHNGIPDHPARARPEAPGPLRVAMVARFDAPKDHLTLLRAVAGIADSLDLVLVGNGPRHEAIREEVARLGIHQWVTFAGARTDVAELLAQVHAFVLSSRWEGLPLTVLEAMRAGLPVVASDVGGVREAVVDGVTGFLVPPGDPDALRDRLRRLAGDPELRRRLGAAGRKRYESLFTLSTMVDRTVGVYREALAAGASEAPMGQS